MNNKKKQELVQRCIEWTTQAEEAICCPICYEIKDKVVLCSMGHHICLQCKNELNNSCPICKSKFTETKSFLIEEVSAMMSNVKISLNDLNKVLQISDNNSEYRSFITILLTSLSKFLDKTSATMNFFSKYLQSPSTSDKIDLEKQFLSLTISLNDLKVYMDNTKVSLNLLKKK